jgi:hypothetical protein
MQPTLEARTADRAIACSRKAIEELAAGTTTRGARHGRQRSRQSRCAPRDDRSQILKPSGMAEWKITSLTPPPEGTVYRRTSKKRVYPTPHLRNSQKCYFVTRWFCSEADAPARPDGARRAPSEIGLAPFFRLFGT